MSICRFHFRQIVKEKLGDKLWWMVSKFAPIGNDTSRLDCSIGVRSESNGV